MEAVLLAGAKVWPFAPAATAKGENKSNKDGIAEIARLTITQRANHAASTNARGANMQVIISQI